MFHVEHFALATVRGRGWETGSTTELACRPVQPLLGLVAASRPGSRVKINVNATYVKMFHVEHFTIPGNNGSQPVNVAQSSPAWSVRGYQNVPRETFSDLTE
jgi:hypothetical protein